MRTISEMKHRNDFNDLRSLSTNSTRELNVHWLHGHSFPMNGVQVAVLKQTNQIHLKKLTKKIYCYWTKNDVHLKILTNLHAKSCQATGTTDVHLKILTNLHVGGTRTVQYVALCAAHTICCEVFSKNEDGEK